MRPFDLIVFDLDGTLYAPCKRLDSVYPEAAVAVLSRRKGWSHARTVETFEVNKKELSRIVGGPVTNTRALLHYYEDVTFAEFEDEVNGRLEIEEMLRPDPRVTGAVETIGAAYRMALFTTNNEKTTDRILKAIGLAGHFPPEKRMSVTDAGRLPLPRREQLEYVKPSQGGYREVLRRQGATAERSLMVGDSEVSDMRPASAVGMHTYKIGSLDDLYALPTWLGLASE